MSHVYPVVRRGLCSRATIANNLSSKARVPLALQIVGGLPEVHVYVKPFTSSPRWVVTGSLIGMLVPRAWIEMLGDYAAVPMCLFRARHGNDRPGRTDPEHRTHQECAQHWGGPQSSQVTTGVPRHPDDATTSLPELHVQPPDVTDRHPAPSTILPVTTSPVVVEKGVMSL